MHSQRTRRAAWLALSAPLLLVGLWVGPVSAQAELDPEPGAEPSDEDLRRAVELYENGEQLYEEGLYEEAITAFEESWTLSRAPLLLFNIANAYERLGDLEQTIDHLNRYRVYAEPEERAALTRRVSNLERRLETAESNDPPSDGEPDPEDPDADPDLAAADGDPAEETAPLPPPEPAMTPLAWSLVAVAGAGLVSGVTFSLLASGSRSDFEATCVDGEGGRICPASSDGLHDDWRRNALIADISYGLAGAAAVGLLLVLLLDSGEDDSGEIGLVPTVWSGGAGFTYGTHF